MINRRVMGLIAEPYARYNLKGNPIRGKKGRDLWPQLVATACVHKLERKKIRIIIPYRTVWLMSPAGCNAVCASRGRTTVAMSGGDIQIRQDTVSEANTSIHQRCQIHPSTLKKYGLASIKVKHSTRWMSA